VISNKIGHGGGGVRLNADGPRPLGRWIERSEIWIRSGIALKIVDGRGSWRRDGGLRLIQVNSKSRRLPPPGMSTWCYRSSRSGSRMYGVERMHDDGTMTTIYRCNES